MEALLQFDQQLFLLVNHLPHPGFLDTLASFFSSIGRAGMVWFGLAVWLFSREEKKDHRFFAPFLATGALSWLLAEVVLKPLVARSRPGLELGAIIVGNGTDGFTFPSGHATIAWAMAVLLSHFEPGWRLSLYLLALTISFSRIYLGVHYPSDVLAGATIGWCIGRVATEVFPRRKQKAGRK